MGYGLSRNSRHNPDADIFKIAVEAAIPEYGDGMYCIYCTYDDEVTETESKI